MTVTVWESCGGDTEVECTSVDVDQSGRLLLSRAGSVVACWNVDKWDSYRVQPHDGPKRARK